jgi:hypothetical protein
MSKRTFYAILTGLVIFDAYLLSKPNLLGKIGLIIFKYYYLRTFPRALVTVVLVCGIAVGAVELISFLIRRRSLSAGIGNAVLILLLVLAFAQLVVTGIDFSRWTYSHTGLKFRLGAFMLPTLVIVILGFGLIKLKREPVVSEVSESDEDARPSGHGLP